MPQLVTVRVARPSRRPLRVWVPVLPVALVFLPVVVLAALVAAVACLVYHVSPVRAFAGGWRIVWALPGTRFDLAHGNTAVRISIS